MGCGGVWVGMGVSDLHTLVLTPRPSHPALHPMSAGGRCPGWTTCVSVIFTYMRVCLRSSGCLVFSLSTTIYTYEREN